MLFNRIFYVHIITSKKNYLISLNFNLIQLYYNYTILSVFLQVKYKII